MDRLIHGKASEWLLVFFLCFVKVDVAHFQASSSGNLWDCVLMDTEQITSMVVYMLVMWLHPTVQGYSAIAHILHSSKHSMSLALNVLYSYSAHPIPSTSISIQHILQLIQHSNQDDEELGRLPLVWQHFIHLMQSLLARKEEENGNVEIPLIRRLFYGLFYDLVPNPFEVSALTVLKVSFLVDLLLFFCCIVRSKSS